jgi:hypothetical protein
VRLTERRPLWLKLATASFSQTFALTVGISIQFEIQLDAAGPLQAEPALPVTEPSGPAMPGPEIPQAPTPTTTVTPEENVPSPAEGQAPEAQPPAGESEAAGGAPQTAAALERLRPPQPHRRRCSPAVGAIPLCRASGAFVTPGPAAVGIQHNMRRRSRTADCRCRRQPPQPGALVQNPPRRTGPDHHLCKGPISPGWWLLR